MGISPEQFERLTKRLERSRSGKARDEASAFVANADHVVLGIDPSLRGTGYGIIRSTGGAVEPLTFGTIRNPAVWPRSRCLAVISQTLRKLIAEFAPTQCVVEGLFFAQNLKTALTMGEARGASLAAAAEAGLDIYEIAPRKVKQAIVGFGGAQKLAVAKMVQRMLTLPEPPAADAADALALALVHARQCGKIQLIPLKRV